MNNVPMEARMFPTSTRTPIYAQLDKGIRPLVKAINTVGLPTYYSCEGHDANRNLIQSPYPFVVVTPDYTPEGALSWLRFMGMLGIYNTNCSDHDDISWTIYSAGNPSIAFHLRPSDLYRPLEDMRKGATSLARTLIKMNRWYKLE